MPAMTILKPLCGADYQLFENLCSFCEQDYPEYQTIFAVRDAADPALPIAQRVIARYPHLDLRLVQDDRVAVPNLKVANVINALPFAKHDIIVVADSDIRVQHDYLREVARPFADAAVGAVTAIYAAEPAGSTPSAIAASFINDHFMPSVLVAIALEKLEFCLGATMAVRKPVLKEIGGFEALGSRLADDHDLGKLVAQRGYRVALAHTVPKTMIREGSLRTALGHELRLARTIFAARPAGYAFSFITFTIPMALIFAPMAGSVALAWSVLAAAVALRVAVHYAARRAYGATQASYLIPVADVLQFCVWIASFFGRTITWRNARFSVERRGALRPL